MTQLLVNIQKQTDLEKLLDFLKSMKIPFIQTEDNQSVVEKTTVNTEEYLSAERIKQLYPNEWVFVASAQNDDNKITGGIVLLHNPNKREMALQAREIIKKHTDTAHFYTGEFPKIRHIGLIRKIK